MFGMSIPKGLAVIALNSVAGFLYLFAVFWTISHYSTPGLVREFADFLAQADWTFYLFTLGLVAAVGNIVPVLWLFLFYQHAPGRSPMRDVLGVTAVSLVLACLLFVGLIRIYPVPVVAPDDVNMLVNILASFGLPLMQMFGAALVEVTFKAVRLQRVLGNLMSGMRS